MQCNELDDESSKKTAKQLKEESQKIDLFLKKEKQKYEELQREPKLLILGSSDSGKTTFLKQLKILHNIGFSKEELEAYKECALLSVITTAEQIISECDKDIQIKYDAITRHLAVEPSPYSFFPLQISEELYSFWQEDTVQSKYQVMESNFPPTLPHFFTIIRELSNPQYTLNNKDILLLRASTKSISDTVIKHDGNTIHFYDVSGLKYHRKQWVPYFQDVLSIVFLVSLSSYDQVMVEDGKTNRMMDAIQLFGHIVNHPLLEKPDTILFFNKRDLYEKKIKTVPIIDHFKEYPGKASSASEGVKFFKGLFYEMQMKKDKPISFHVTCCTDTGAMKVICSNVITSIVTRQAQGVGLI